MRYLLHDVFTTGLTLSPNNIAITEENGKELTYTELDHLANQFANCFITYKQEHEIRDAPFIGILSMVQIHSVAAIIGALKIGCSYVPLDEFSPVERLRYVLDNTQLDLLVIDPYWVPKFLELFAHPALKHVILLDHSKTEFCHPKIVAFAQVVSHAKNAPKIFNQVSDDLAYVLHSSGSTGVPKGIMLTHRNARTFVDWMHKEFVVTATDVVMSRAPFKFDLSVFDIFNTFKAGARLVCFDWRCRREANKRHYDYVSLMVREKATILYTTPSTFITLTNHGALERARATLTRVMYAGEPFAIPALKKLQTVLPQTKIANIYGPTETNIITYYWIDKITEDMTAIPLGEVVDDTEILVVSEDQKRICSPGEVGELWCRGGTTTLGYLGMPEKTQEHLVTSPFHRYPAKFWRTGDFGYRDTSGLLYYRGRRDHMVKVKGYRIEIGEVEAAVAKFAGLDEFAVVNRPHQEYGNELICFVSFQQEVTNQVVALQDFLKILLPLYMVPIEFIKLEQLPHTSSGKIDRVVLLEEAEKRLRLLLLEKQ
jgi:amino acid adenylation domain-containing protein